MSFRNFFDFSSLDVLTCLYYCSEISLIQMDNDRLPCPSLRQPVPGSKIELKSTGSVKRNAKNARGLGKDK